MKPDSQTLNDHSTHKVVVNHEEQYSILHANADNPLGWQNAGVFGTKEECLAYIEGAWTDMRPLTLRRQMEAENKGCTPISK